MHEITSLELGVLIRELKGKVIGSYLKKFYDLGNDSFRMVFHSAEGNTIVYCNLFSTLNQTEFVEESGEATNFAIAVRRKVEDSKVTDFRQHGSDRIAVLELSARGTMYRMVIEMFGKGNLILLDEKGDIALCYKRLSFKDREIKPKAHYEFPRSSSLNIDSIDPADLDDILLKISDSGNKIISELSKYLNLGPIYLEDIINSAGLNPRDKLTKHDSKRLKEAISAFAESLKSPRPVRYIENGATLDYSVVPLKKYERLKSVGYDTLNQLLDDVYKDARITSTEAESESNKELEEMNANISKQQALINEFSSNSVRYSESAHKIFARMSEINALINEIKEKKKPELRELKANFPDLGVQELNLKDKIVVIDI